MKTPQQCENLLDIRAAIDDLDRTIVESIALRARYVKEAARFKKDEGGVKDPDRVAAVIASKMALAEECGVSAELIGSLYKIMIEYFVNEELREWKTK